MTAPRFVWAYIVMGFNGSSCGRAQLMRRRGWTVGEPVNVLRDGHHWHLPCSREAQP